MAPTLPFLLFSLLTLSGSLAANQAVTLTSNATAIVVGQSIKLRCEVTHSVPETESYSVEFYQNNAHFCYYYISHPDPSGHRSTTFDNETYSHPSLGRQPLSSTFPVYEITVTPTISSTSQFFCLLAPSGSTNDESRHLSLTVKPTPSSKRALITSNATLVKVGQSFKLRCELDNYTPGNEHYWVYFHQKNPRYYFFCEYYISEPDSTGQRKTSFSSQSNNEPSLVRQPLSSTFPVYEITVTPTLAGTKQFYCQLSPGNSGNAFSKEISLNITASPSTAHLTSNTTTPVPNHPFTLTCTFADFIPPPVDYSVTFYSLRDGKLAAFEVAHGKALLSDSIHSQVGVFPGQRSTFPTFDLVLTEKGDTSSFYWCALEETGKAPVVSDTWPALLQFNASKSSEGQRVGTCAVGATSLNLTSGKAFSVQFWSDLGPETDNLLAKYTFRPNLIEEFKSSPIAPWNTIGHGPDASWPTFSILANGTGSLHGAWWCSLVVGAKESLDYREFKSNTAVL